MMWDWHFRKSVIETLDEEEGLLLEEPEKEKHSGNSKLEPWIVENTDHDRLMARPNIKNRIGHIIVPLFCGLLVGSVLCSALTKRLSAPQELSKINELIILGDSWSGGS